MNCPVCDIELTKYQISDIELDVCTKCDGVWFDRGELQHIINSLLSTDIIPDQPLKEALRKKAYPVNESQNRNLLCPRCKKQLDLKNFSFDSNVFVDLCSFCHGLWTDKGELLEIAKYMKGNEELQSYAFGIAESFQFNDVWYIKILKDWHCHIAGIVSIAYIIIGYMLNGSETALKITFQFLPLPLILIWFGDTIGRVTGMIGLRPNIIKTSPGYIVKILGWAILMVPFWLTPLLTLLD